MTLMSRYLGNIENKRAEQTWKRIQERPAEIVIVRNRSTTLAAQTVRVEYATAERDIKSEDSISNARAVIVYGVKNHPDAEIADSDIQRGDRFKYNGQQWVVESVVHVLGGIQAKGAVSE